MLRKSYRLMQKTYFGAAKQTFGTDFYARSITPQTPCALSVCAATPWIGDARRGAEMRDFIAHTGPAQIRALVAAANADQLDAHFHGLSVLYDLRSLGTDVAAQAAARLVLAWVAQNPKWHAGLWAAPLLMARLRALIGCHAFYAGAFSSAEQSALAASLASQGRHLKNTLPSLDEPSTQMAAAAALVATGAVVPSESGLVETGLALADQILPHIMTADGGMMTRRADQALPILQALIEMRGALQAAALALPPFIAHAMDRLVPALRFFLHGDGAYATFHGMNEGVAETIAHTLECAGRPGRTPASLPYTGFERLSAGDTMLLLDRAAPSATHHHHSLGAFEMSVGHARLIVNCGQHARDPMWQDLLSSSAAHSALTLDGADTTMPGRNVAVDVARRDLDHAEIVQLTHDGYYTRNGYHHTRRLMLSRDGLCLTGEDHVSTAVPPVMPNTYTIRFHLHPRIAAAITGNATVLLRLPNHQGWSFTLDTGTVALEDSVYLGGTGLPQKTRQIVVTGDIHGASQMVKWVLRAI